MGLFLVGLAIIATIGSCIAIVRKQIDLGVIYFIIAGAALFILGAITK